VKQREGRGLSAPDGSVSLKSLNSLFVG